MEHPEFVDTVHGCSGYFGVEVEPGRFLSSKGASSYSQQVNAGWPGPRLCNNYATLWRESSPAVDQSHFSDFVLRAQDGLHPEVAIMTENVLETNGPKVKGGLKCGCAHFPGPNWPKALKLF